MAEIDPSRKPAGERPRAASGRNLRTPEHRQRGGIVFRIALLVALIIPAAITSPWYVVYAAPLPDVSQLDSDVPGDTIVYANDGTTVLADLHAPGSQHYYEPLSSMGSTLPDAVVAIEDRNFYYEPGIDPA